MYIHSLPINVYRQIGFVALGNLKHLCLANGKYRNQIPHWVRKFRFLIFACLRASIFASQGSDALPPLPLGGFRQVFKHSADMQLTSFVSYKLVSGSLVMYQFAFIRQWSIGSAYGKVFTTYKPYRTYIFDANGVSRILAECLKTCLNPQRGEEGSGSEHWLAKIYICWYRGHW